MANFHHCKVHYIWASLYNGNLDVCISEILTQLMFTVFCTLEFEVTLNETVGYRIFAIFFIYFGENVTKILDFAFHKIFKCKRIWRKYFSGRSTLTVSPIPPPPLNTFVYVGRKNKHLGYSTQYLQAR